MEASFKGNFRELPGLARSLLSTLHRLDQEDIRHV
jgi:hypothetical protein